MYDRRNTHKDFADNKNSKNDQAWSIRGISDEVRKSVVDRARQEGRTVGSWVSEALSRALQEDALTQQVLELRRRVEALEASARPSGR